MKDGVPVAFLNAAFQRKTAWRYLSFLRVSTILFLFVNLGLIVTDISRFDTDSNTFTTVLILRLAVLAPICVGIVVWTYTKWYVDYTQLLVWPDLALGCVPLPLVHPLHSLWCDARLRLLFCLSFLVALALLLPSASSLSCFLCWVATPATARWRCSSCTCSVLRQ